MPKDLTNFFCPKSIAVIGASRSPEKVGAVILKNIIDSGFNGKIYPINPNAEEINGLKCYADITNLPETPDLIIIAIPTQGVLTVLEELGKKAGKNAIVITAGFKETGPKGIVLEKQIQEIVQKYNLNLLGPNCLGFVNNSASLNATFSNVNHLTGNLRFISQSGAIASSIFDWCQKTKLGFNEFVTLGNKADINENDVLQYFLDHQQQITEVGLSNLQPIGMYLESIANGVEFIKIVRKTLLQNPIFLLKPGKTKASQKAMQSHTGAIAGEDYILDAVLKQEGIIRCQTLEDFFDYSRAFAWERVPNGKRVAIISNAGGPAVISSDAIINEGLELAEFSEEIKNKLLEILPRSASVINPVDVLGDALADRFVKAAEIVLQSENTDALIIILTPQVMTEIEKTAQAIGELSKKYQKPILCSFIGGTMVAEGEQILDDYKIPSYRFPERAISALAAMWKYKQHLIIKTEETSPRETNLDFSMAKTLFFQAQNHKQKTLDCFDINKLLISIGLSAPATTQVSNFDEARSFVRDWGYPIVLKINSLGLLHKTDIDGVVTNISRETELSEAVEKLQAVITKLNAKANIQAQKDIENGVEVIVGVKRDPTFGPILLFGAGGTLSELLVDRNLFLLPIDLPSAKKLVLQSKIYTLLKGYRGGSMLALERLYDLMVRLAKLAEEFPEITEIEINPVIVTHDDTYAVDGKIILQ